MPQPTHCVWSITAFPSFIEIAGHPSFMQALQPLHLSASTFSAGLCLTYFSNAQGRLEIITDGSSTASSSLIAASVSASE